MFIRKRVFVFLLFLVFICVVFFWGWFLIVAIMTGNDVQGLGFNPSKKKKKKEKCSGSNESVLVKRPVTTFGEQPDWQEFRIW